MKQTKPFSISKQSVMTAWEKVRANKGAYGVDEQSMYINKPPHILVFGKNC